MTNQTHDNVSSSAAKAVSNVVNGVVWEPLVVSVKDAIRISCMSRTYLYELIGNGSIASRKIGKKRLLIYSSLKAFLTAQPTEQGEWRSL
jgi:excisionase family DNA binding protein